MKFYPLDSEVPEKDNLVSDLKNGHEIGVITLGDKCLFFKRYLKTFYIPYTDLKRAYRRVLLVPAKMCCASGELPVESLVIHNSKDEEVAVVSVPGGNAPAILLKEIGEKSADTITVCPPKPAEPKKPGKSAKSQQAHKNKEGGN